MLTLGQNVLMFLARCSCMCAANIVRLAEKNDVKRLTTLCACFYCCIKSWDGFKGSTSS